MERPRVVRAIYGEFGRRGDAVDAILESVSLKNQGDALTQKTYLTYIKAPKRHVFQGRVNWFSLSALKKRVLAC